MAGYSFPESFKWGAATAAYQIEGAANEDGRKPSIWDNFCRWPGKVFDGHSGDVACDHYHRYAEDIGIMKQLGLQAYRFSFSWPRIMPDGTGSVNEKGLDFYDRLIDGLLEAGIEPWGTLFHWDLPMALHERGGWLNPEIRHWFADYARAVSDRYSDRVKNFMTINEPQVIIAFGYADGKFAPGLQLPLPQCIQTVHNLLLAHGEGVRAIREAARGPVRVGHAAQYMPSLPNSESAEDISAARQATFATCKAEGPLDTAKMMWSFALYHDPMLLGSYPADFMSRCGHMLPKIHAGDMETISEPMDFLGINIYWGEPVRATAEGPQVVPYAPGCPRNSFGWAVTPEALYWGGRFCQERYGKKDIYITENGCPVTDWPTADGKVHDPMRIDYLDSYLCGVRRGIQEGIPFKGYFCWSLMDNFEWAAGYSQRFGIVYVDYATGKRTIKDSGHWYADLIKNNGATLS
ncbi:MAG: beta-glucosidase [Opitutales bacterium]|nr:beta-glucosidase [Opitutales bacterium]